MKDAGAWVPLAFEMYRSGMQDKHPAAHELARIEHDFIAAFYALNFDDQTRQQRLAFKAKQSFHHANR